MPEEYIMVERAVDCSLSGEQTLWRYVGLECCMSLGDIVCKICVSQICVVCGVVIDK